MIGLIVKWVCTLEVIVFEFLDIPLLIYMIEHGLIPPENPESWIGF